METTFITIHDLSPESIITYASDSIVDVLDWCPNDVVGHSTWLFFKSTDVQNAQNLHQRSIYMDKASVLVYCDLLNRNGEWIRCECCFSIVYDALVACTSIYRETIPGLHRRANAPVIRRLFSSSRNDPRYHMLQHLSRRFQQPPEEQSREPRAALFLNRFTKSLSIMHATSAIEQVIGVSSEYIRGKSFYHCVTESCLDDAVRCLETAKGNDSIAYLRFLYRDPRQDDEIIENGSSAGGTDAEMTDVDISESEAEIYPGAIPQQPGTAVIDDNESFNGGLNTVSSHSGTTSSILTPITSEAAPLELEAVISCTSDGLVVCLRRARPVVPSTYQNAVHPTTTVSQPYTGFYAAPWGTQPWYHPDNRPAFDSGYPGAPTSYSGAQAPYHAPQPNTSLSEHDFMRAIQECAVFAWDLVGINDSLSAVARGEPAGEAIPPIKSEIGSPGNSSSGRGTGSGSSGEEGNIEL